MILVEPQTEKKQYKYKARYPILWRLMIGLIALYSVMIVLFCVVMVFINTPMGKNFLATQIEKRTYGHIQIQGLSGFVPSNLAISKIQFKKDVIGVWAEVKDAQLKWSPLALLWNKISIRSFVAQEVDFYNLPPKPENTDNHLSKAEYHFVELSLPVDIQHFQIDRLFISDKIAKKNITIRIDGKVKIRNLSNIMNVNTIKTAFMAHPKLRLTAIKQPADFQFGGKISGSIENQEGKGYKAALFPLHFSIILPEYPKPNSHNELKIYLGLGDEI